MHGGCADGTSRGDADTSRWLLWVETFLAGQMFSTEFLLSSRISFLEQIPTALVI
jgi:hypothetical protein